VAADRLAVEQFLRIIRGLFWPCATVKDSIMTRICSWRGMNCGGLHFRRSRWRFDILLCSACLLSTFRVIFFFQNKFVLLINKISVQQINKLTRIESTLTLFRSNEIVILWENWNLFSWQKNWVNFAHTNPKSSSRSSPPMLALVGPPSLRFGGLVGASRERSTDLFLS
jgi:hypothetical protein